MNAPDDPAELRDPEDRLVEYALERLFGAEAEPDLAPRVAAAWARGHRGAELDELDSLLNGGPHPGLAPRAADARAPARRGARPRLVLAAAVLLPLLLGLAAWLLREAGRGTPALARASLPFTVLRGPEVATVASVELRSGDFLVVDAIPASLTLEGGGRIAADPGTLLLLRDARPGIVLELVRGSLALLETPAGLSLRTDLATLLPEPGANLVVRLLPDAPARAPATAARAFDAAPEELVRAHQAGAPTPPLLLELAVEAGRALLRPEPGDGAEEGLVALEAGDKRLLSGRRAAGLAKVLDEDARLAELFLVGAFEWDAGPGRAAPGYLDPPPRPRELEAFLAERPRRWALVPPLITRVLSDGKLPKPRTSALLDLALDSPAPEALAAARELWLLVPEVFRSMRVVALAERGAFEFERESRAMLDELEPRDPELVLPAVYLAERGDETAVEALRALHAEPAQLEPSLRLLAAAALERAGVPGAWAEAREAAADTLRARLRGFDSPGAARVGLDAGFIDGLRRAPGVLELGSLPARLELFRAERAPELEGEEAILRLLDGF